MPTANFVHRFVANVQEIQAIWGEDPTHIPYSGQRPDVLDIVTPRLGNNYVKDVTRHIQISSVADLLTDHNPLFITVQEM